MRAGLVLALEHDSRENKEAPCRAALSLSLCIFCFDAAIFDRILPLSKVFVANGG